MEPSHAETLRLIELAVIRLQGVYSPSRPMFMALDRVQIAVRRARNEAGSRGVPIEHTTG